MTSPGTVNFVSGKNRPSSFGKLRKETLTAQQTTQLATILLKYDPDTMTDEAIQSMQDELIETGIRPGELLKNALKNAGFEVVLQPIETRNTESEISQFVQDFIDKIVSGHITDDDVAILLKTGKTRLQDQMA